MSAETPLLVSQARRASSIRTRIKTRLYPPYGMNIYALAEHLPLEQGLRQEEMGSILSLDFTLAEHLPLEQGLRPQNWAHFSSKIRISRRASSIRTRIKTRKVFGLLLHQYARRASSIRTRIKTWLRFSSSVIIAPSQSIFH